MTKKIIYLLLSLVILVSLQLSCKHTVLDEGPIVDTDCDPEKVYFVNDVQPILNSYCTYSGCHDASSHKDGVDLSSYNQIISTGEVKAGNPNGSELYEVIEEGEMPPSPNTKLTSDQRQIIYDWIAQGAIYNECIVDDCDTINVKYSTHIQPIISSYCQGCHSGGNPDGGISLSSFSDVETIANNGSLLSVIEHKSGYSPMPKNADKLSDCDIAKIKIWINEGTQNN